MHVRTAGRILTCCLFALVPLSAQPGSSISSETLRGLELRGVGPAVMGGRIADIAIHPEDSTVWYVAVGSGGVWKTVNAGITWTPIFDQEPSYSIGCVTLDPSNPDTVWVGTGENVSGRHVGWGDGVYKSLDGGRTWKRTGLEGSQHIGKIVVDPRDGNVVFAAAEGPLWSPGGDRGLYKSSDGGASWESVLTVDPDTGVTDVEFDPRQPDVLYAATYQRRRHVWSLLAGGPGSGVHKTVDGGATWKRLSEGLPKGHMGKIGLAVSPADPDVVYATIEAGEEERGFYRSLDRGESWEKRNSYISNGTGPHYYQEIEASPHHVDHVYQMDVFLHVTRDGGETFQILGTGREKHSDNHALYIDPEDPLHLIAGTDGGLYESYDDGVKWRHFGNLPVSQFYKMALDSSLPFYNILGGAQDLGTLLGPSRTLNIEGVRNRDWYVPMGADGYACAFDPEDPNVIYLEWQQGRLHRYDRRSEEALDIQPQPAPDDPPERWNWDAPLLVSPHSRTRLYYGSQRLWRSDDRGDSWTPVSGDLTGNHNRYELKVMDRVQSIDALYDNGAMSWYSTLTAISESPRVEGLLYVGSDDGLIHVSEDGGGNWRRAAAFPAVPDLSFVNDIEASLHDEDVLFAALDAHKIGDLTPYLLRSRDRGRSWQSIVGDLPAGHIVWAIEQDHVDPDLLFIATEFGLFFTVDGGDRWVELQGGVPTIAFRDLELQRRDDDLVGASFGRGFYVLDDYSALREIAGGALDRPAALFPVRDAYWYVPSVPMQAKGKPSQGSSDFTAPNPPFGAVFTYYLDEAPQTAREERLEGEEKLSAEGADIPFPGWDELRREAREESPRLLFTVRDSEGTAVRRISVAPRAGVQRVAWDLRLPPPQPVDLDPPGFRPPWADPPRGPLAPPGSYQVELALHDNAGVEPIAGPRSFQVKPLPGETGDDFDVVAAFQRETGELMRQALSAAAELRRAGQRLRHMRAALDETPRAEPGLFEGLDDLAAQLADFELRLVGDNIRRRRNEPVAPAILGRIRQVAGGHWETRQPATATQQQSLELAREGLTSLTTDLSTFLETAFAEMEAALEAAGAPWTPGRKLP